MDLDGDSMAVDPDEDGGGNGGDHGNLQKGAARR
jgi:hypothetical protein